MNVFTAEFFLITLIYTRERCFLSFDRLRLKASGTEDKSASCRVCCPLGIDCFILFFPNTKHEHMLPETIAFSASPPQSFFKCHISLLVFRTLPATLSTYTHSTPFFSPGACACLAHTGDNPNTAELKQTHFAWMKTSHFPLSLLARSLLPLSFSCSFCRGAFSLATVKINCSGSIYFTQEDLTTTENLTSCFRLYLPDFHRRMLLSQALICYFVALNTLQEITFISFLLPIVTSQQAWFSKLGNALWLLLVHRWCIVSSQKPLMAVTILASLFLCCLRVDSLQMPGSGSVCRHEWAGVPFLRRAGRVMIGLHVAVLWPNMQREVGGVRRVGESVREH